MPDIKFYNLCCKFCGGTAAYAPLPNLVSTIDIFFCHKCKAEYINIYETYSISLYTEINNETYRWTVQSNFAILYHIIDPGEPGVRKNGYCNPVKYFNSNNPIPVITPQNINEKIRTWLLML